MSDDEPFTGVASRNTDHMSDLHERFTQMRSHRLLRAVGRAFVWPSSSRAFLAFIWSDAKSISHSPDDVCAGYTGGCANDTTRRLFDSFATANINLMINQITTARRLEIGVAYRMRLMNDMKVAYCRTAGQAVTETGKLNRFWN